MLCASPLAVATWRSSYFHDPVTVARLARTVRPHPQFAMAVSSYRKSFAFANTSNMGGKMLVLQAQDSHRSNLRRVRASIDTGMPRGFAATSTKAQQRPQSASRRARPSSSSRRGGLRPPPPDTSGGAPRGRRRSASTWNQHNHRPSIASASSQAGRARGGTTAAGEGDTQQLTGQPHSTRVPICAADVGAVRANMTADGLQIYDQFVHMLSTFDKSVMLDLVEDALKDAHDQSLLADWRPLR